MFQVEGRDSGQWWTSSVVGNSDADNRFPTAEAAEAAIEWLVAEYADNESPPTEADFRIVAIDL